MSTPQERLNELMQNMSELEISEVVDFAEFIESKRQKLFEKAFESVVEVEENLTEEEITSIKDSRQSGNISYKEMWNDNGL